MARKLPERTITPPTSPERPRHTGMGAKGMGRGFHGHPGNAVGMAKGGGHHGVGVGHPASHRPTPPSRDQFPTRHHTDPNWRPPGH